MLYDWLIVCIAYCILLIVAIASTFELTYTAAVFVTTVLWTLTFYFLMCAIRHVDQWPAGIVLMQWCSAGIVYASFKYMVNCADKRKTFIFSCDAAVVLCRYFVIVCCVCYFDVCWVFDIMLYWCAQRSIIYLIDFVRVLCMAVAVSK